MRSFFFILFLSFVCFGEFLETDSILGNIHKIQFNDTVLLKVKPITAYPKYVVVFDSGNDSNKIKRCSIDTFSNCDTADHLSGMNDSNSLLWYGQIYPGAGYEINNTQFLRYNHSYYPSFSLTGDRLLINPLGGFTGSLLFVYGPTAWVLRKSNDTLKFTYTSYSEAIDSTTEIIDTTAVVITKNGLNLSDSSRGSDRLDGYHKSYYDTVGNGAVYCDTPYVPYASTIGINDRYLKTIMKQQTNYLEIEPLDTLYASLLIPDNYYVSMTADNSGYIYALSYFGTPRLIRMTGAIGAYDSYTIKNRTWTEVHYDKVDNTMYATANYSGGNQGIYRWNSDSINFIFYDSVYYSIDNSVNGITTSQSGDLFVCAFDNYIYRQIAKTGDFIPYADRRYWVSLCSVGDTIYAFTSNAGIFRKTPSGTSFDQYDVTVRGYGQSWVDSSGNIYVVQNSAPMGIYRRSFGTTSFQLYHSYALTDVYGGTYSNGNNFVCTYNATGDVYRFDAYYSTTVNRLTINGAATFNGILNANVEQGTTALNVNGKTNCLGNIIAEDSVFIELAPTISMSDTIPMIRNDGLLGRITKANFLTGIGALPLHGKADSSKLSDSTKHNAPHGVTSGYHAYSAGTNQWSTSVMREDAGKISLNTAPLSNVAFYVRNTPTNSGQYGIYNLVMPTVNSTGTYGAFGILSTVYSNLSGGANDNGMYYGITGSAYHTTTGTIAQQYGLYYNFGTQTNNSSISGLSFGLRLNPYFGGSGSVASAGAIYISGLQATGATVANKWCLYSELPWKSRLDTTLEIDNDVGGIAFGEGQDAIIEYDGTNMIFNSRLVGTGDFDFQNGVVRTDSFQVGSTGSVFTNFTMYNGTHDTLKASSGGTTWNFLPTTEIVDSVAKSGISYGVVDALTINHSTGDVILAASGNFTQNITDTANVNFYNTLNYMVLGDNNNIFVGDCVDDIDGNKIVNCSDSINLHSANSNFSATGRIRIDPIGGLFVTIKSGTSQAGAGAAAGEVWVNTADSTLRLGF